MASSWENEVEKIKQDGQAKKKELETKYKMDLHLLAEEFLFRTGEVYIREVSSIKELSDSPKPNQDKFETLIFDLMELPKLDEKVVLEKIHEIRFLPDKKPTAVLLIIDVHNLKLILKELETKSNDTYKAWQECLPKK